MSSPVRFPAVTMVSFFFTVPLYICATFSFLFNYFVQSVVAQAVYFNSLCNQG